MKFILLETGQNGYRLITVPDYISDNAHHYQREFDKWLMDKNNNHGYWHKTKDDEGEYMALAYDSPDAFTKWLNETVLYSNSSEKAKIISGEIPVLHF